MKSFMEDLKKEKWCETGSYPERIYKSREFLVIHKKFLQVTIGVYSCDNKIFVLSAKMT